MDMTRRTAVKSFAALSALLPFHVSAVGSREDAPFKICVFADMHYNPGGWPNDDVGFLDRILKRAEDEACSMIFQLGDFEDADLNFWPDLAV